MQIYAYIRNIFELWQKKSPLQTEKGKLGEYK